MWHAAVTSQKSNYALLNIYFKTDVASELKAIEVVTGHTGAQSTSSQPKSTFKDLRVAQSVKVEVLRPVVNCEKSQNRLIFLQDDK